jgi:high-affinity iron transporter
MLNAVLPPFVLFLREGLEASLIVSILLATLRQLGQMQYARAVWSGVVLAILGALGAAAVIYATIRQYPDTTGQTVFETATYLVAVVLLTYMTFWMQRHSRSLKSEIAAKASSAGSGFAFGLLAFSMVGREGLESAVFTLAFAFQTNGLLLLAGALLGAAAAVALCVGIYRLGYRLDFRVFFRVMGILLIIFAAGLLGDAVQNLQALGWLRVGTLQLWNTSHILSEDSPFGDLMHSLIGYAETPTVLQALAYATYVAIAGGLFWRLTRKPPQLAPHATSSSTSVVAKQA